MTSSAVKYSNIRPISPTSSDKLAGDDLQHGKAYINETDRGVYVKDIYGNVLRCGDSYRNLEDFPDFLLKERGENVFVTLVKDDLGQLHLGTSIPFIKLESLGNTDLPSTGQEYLGFNSLGQLTSLPSPAFQVNDLADVRVINASFLANNWVLTWQATNETNITTSTGRLKDAQGEPVLGYWTLLPEASTIKHFTDCTYTAEAPYQVFRIRRVSDTGSYTYTNIPFTIADDDTPILGGDLRAERHSIINQQHTQRTINPTATVSYIAVTPGVDSMIVVSPSTVVKLLDIDIMVDTSKIDTVYHTAMVIKNYAGSMKFNEGTVFENGLSIATLGYDILLTITVSVDPDITISVNQKALTLQ
jgi:hypothetical protein